MADPGAVDPVRIPPWLGEAAERAWLETPPLARLFIGLAFVDVVSRGLGILQPRYDVGGDLLALYAMLIPHDLWILLPAILVLRRPDAARATPLVLAGAVTIAILTLVERPLDNLFSGGNGPPTMLLEVGLLQSIARFMAWLLLARGLVALNPRQPIASAAGLSNLVLVLGSVALVLDLGRSFATSADFGDPNLNGIVALSNLLAFVATAGWLYLLWVIIRGIGDTRRPPLATTIAATGAAVAALLGAATSFLGAIVSAANSPVQLGGGLALIDVSSALDIVTMGIGYPLVIVGFALGLGEPPVPYVRPAPAPEAPTAESPLGEASASEAPPLEPLSAESPAPEASPPAP